MLHEGGKAHPPLSRQKLFRREVESCFDSADAICAPLMRKMVNRLSTLFSDETGTTRGTKATTRQAISDLVHMVQDAFPIGSEC